MSSVVRSILGAALLMTGASTAMAQYANPPAAGQAPQTVASTAPAATPGAYQAPQAGTATAAAAPAYQQYQKSYTKAAPEDKADRYGGNNPNSLAGNRAFWDSMNPY